jgi:hypothetical protein
LKKSIELAFRLGPAPGRKQDDANLLMREAARKFILGLA